MSNPIQERVRLSAINMGSIKNSIIRITNSVKRGVSDPHSLKALVALRFLASAMPKSRHNPLKSSLKGCFVRLIYLEEVVGAKFVAIIFAIVDGDLIIFDDGGQMELLGLS